ncbi:unnamed protein product, partial [Prorocentrum cordatum]
MFHVRVRRIRGRPRASRGAAGARGTTSSGQLSVPPPLLVELGLGSGAETCENIAGLETEKAGTEEANPPDILGSRSLLHHRGLRRRCPHGTLCADACRRPCQDVMAERTRRSKIPGALLYHRGTCLASCDMIRPQGEHVATSVGFHSFERSPTGRLDDQLHPNFYPGQDPEVFTDRRGPGSCPKGPEAFAEVAQASHPTRGTGWKQRLHPWNRRLCEAAANGPGAAGRGELVCWALCAGGAADARQSWMAVSADAKKAGTEALRGGGADVTDDDVAELVLKVRSTLNAGRAPRSKRDEARRLEAALDPVAVRLASGSPEVPGSEMAEALWGFTEAATFATQTEGRIRRVAADADGWETIADRIWARAVGADGNTLPVDWVLHLGIGLFLSSLAVVLGADSVRHRLAGGAVGLVGTFQLVRRVPKRAAEVPAGPLHPPGLAALPPPPWAPPAEGAGAGAAAAKPGAQDLSALRAFAQGFHVPHAPADAVKLGREVEIVGATLREFQAQAAINEDWAWHFWERIAAVDGSRGLHPDLRRVLQTHGYVGAGTKTPPGESLQQELDALLASPTAPHGGGMRASPGWAVAPQTQQHQEDSRWNLSLPPELRRAAPEIYRTMRGAGAASARDWLSQEVTGQRRTAVWTDLWTAATNVDYLLGGCATQSELLARLASDDALELHLRRLASYVYEMRTKDKVGGAAMLAVRPPGSAADLAPTWLVTEATTHSQAEHQRDERAAAVAGAKELMNGMDRGSLEARPTGQRETSDNEMRLAWQLVQQYALQDAARYERDCRGLAPTGGQGTDLACDRGPQDAYTGERKGVSKHVMMCAAAGGGLEAGSRGDAEPEDAQQHRYDDDWLGQQSSCRAALPSPRGYSVAEWLETVRRAKRDDERVMVVMHLFAGRRRRGDVQEVVERLAKERCLRVLFLSADLLDDPRWDLANPSTFSALMELCEGGWVDIVLGGPPCSTWSRARYNRHRPGPPPVRSRRCPWGLSGLRDWEAARVAESNTLTLNLLALCEACGQSGGAFLIEHPEDPGRAPYPSIWNTTEMLDFETRRSSRRARLDQCMLGGRTKKPTCLSGTLQGLEDLNELRRDGPHAHETAEGKLADGTFRTSPLAQYPEGMCEKLGTLIVQTLAIFEQTGLGGTGWRRPPGADRSVTAWSSRSTTTPAVAVRNEDVLRGRGLVLDGPQMAFYLHVDDGVAMAGGSGCGPRASGKMHQLADALAEAGFVVTDRTEASDMQKVLGCAPQARPAQLRLPPKRARELVQQLEAMGATRSLHTEELRSLLGVWIWGALLRRELLCMPSAVFRLLERHPRQRVCTWATVRRELRAMARVVPLMYADLGAPPAPAYFAADAMGANVEDDGGWGILVTDMCEDIAKDFIDTGGSLGYTVARLDGELTGLRRPEQVIRRTKPFSLLPDRVFKPDEDWTIVGAGRWRAADHITLGEGRCVVKISRLAAATPALHRTVLPILEDNQPVSGAVCKGRSPAHMLNHLLRQKTAAGMASRTKILITWVEALRQPADKISRKLDSTSVEKVKPHTLAAYRAAAMKFVTYLDERGFVPDGPEQWDDLLVEYKNDMQMTKCNFEYAVAAVEFVFPRLRRKLTWSHSVIDAWRVSAEVKRAPPLGRAPANLAAIYFSCWGVPRLGVGLLLQVDRGLRPSEMLQLRAKDISLPSSRGGPDLQPNWVINLGAKSATKAKRMQFAIILEQGGVLENLLHRVVLGTPPEGLLFPYSLVDYRHRLKQFEAAPGLDIHWTPHSARAGFASDSVARGVPFQDIKEAGRWLTESSLRIYVDVVTASRVLAQAEQRGIAPLIREAAEKLPHYFPEGIFGEGEGLQHAASGLAQGPAPRAPAQPPAPALGALVDGLLAGPQQPGDAAAGAGAAEAEAPAPAAPGVAALRPPQPLVAQPLAAGAAAGQRRARWSSGSLLRAAWLIARWCGRSTTRGVTWAAVAAMLIGWSYMAGPLAHLGTMMGVVASGVSDFAVTSSRSSASLLQEAWRGVDITNLHVRQRHAERLADDPEILQAWIEREFLTDEPRPPGAEQVTTAISEASVNIPHMSERWQMMIWPSQYRELHMTLDLLPSGFYGVHLVERIVNFKVQWSNPVWSSLDCDISSERDT